MQAAVTPLLNSGSCSAEYPQAQLDGNPAKNEGPNKSPTRVHRAAWRKSHLSSALWEAWQSR